MDLSVHFGNLSVHFENLSVHFGNLSVHFIFEVGKLSKFECTPFSEYRYHIRKIFAFFLETEGSFDTNRGVSCLGFPI